MSLIDALKQNLGPAHVSWVNDIDDSYTLEDVDVAIYNKGMFVDHRENKGDSSGRAAYSAADQADARDLTISELTACIARLEDQVNKLTSGGSSSLYWDVSLLQEAGSQDFRLQKIKGQEPCIWEKFWWR